MKFYRLIVVLFVVLFAALWQIDSPGASSITGSVSYTGNIADRTELRMASDPFCKRAHKGAVYSRRRLVNAQRGIANVFVYIKDFKGAVEPGESLKPVLLDQRGCLFFPFVLGVQINQKLTIRNSDATMHNVHALTKKNTEFNIGMPLKGQEETKTFTKEEVMVKIKCDVHSWMSTYIGVLPHSFYSVTEPEGTFSIANVPPGKYTLEAWHEVFGTKTKAIELVDKPVNIDFIFSGS